jgi:hypothetical protein
MATKVDVAAERALIDGCAELEKAGPIGDARDDLAHVVEGLRIGRRNADQLFGRVVWCLGASIERQRGGLRQLRHDLTCDADSVGVVLGQVFAGAGDASVHVGAAELLGGGHLARGSSEQRWSCQEELSLAAHQHDVIAERDVIGAAGCGVAVGDPDLRNA